MTTSRFKVGGPLTDDHIEVYISRQADQDVVEHLLAMNYLLLIEPRQQGKTSLIHHIKRQLAFSNLFLIYIDVTTPDHSSEEIWYQTFCIRMLRQITTLICPEQWPRLPRNSSSWRDFLSEIAAYLMKTNQKVVIALDEIGAMTFPGATEFFSVLRDVYNSRAIETEFKHLTFLLSGAFHPRDLIKDNTISPFNVAQRIRLEDFTLEQVQKLVSKGSCLPKQAILLAERIHYWTDGQPYLTQILCTYLGSNTTPANIKAIVERLCIEDENHLPPLLERLHEDKKLRWYVNKIYKGDKVKHTKENRRLALLELLGILKVDKNGYCQIRNRIYEQVLYPKGQQPVYGTGNRWAVLVGVNTYEDQNNYGQLHVCGKDVHAIHDRLVNSGFDSDRIRLLTDNTLELPTRHNILVALKAVADATEPNDLLLFYYSGHGDEIGGGSYLVARDGRRVLLSDTALSIARIKTIMEQAPARAKVIVLDACHSGVDIGAKGPKGMTDGFIRSVFEQAEGMAILASCMQGQLSYEWEVQERSVFTHFFLEALQGSADHDRKGFVTVQDANRYVVNHVKLWASQQNVNQTPTLESRVVGDIILTSY